MLTDVGLAAQECQIQREWQVRGELPERHVRLIGRLNTCKHGCSSLKLGRPDQHR